MKTFFKWFGLALGVQVSLIFLGAEADSLLKSGDALLSRVLLPHYPFMLLIQWWGNYHGEASMLEPIIRGVPLGIFVYGLLAGALAVMIKRFRRVG